MNNENSHEIGFEIIESIFKQIIVNRKDLCIKGFTRHANIECVNAIGVKNINLLHWPNGRECTGHGDNTRCTFLHPDQRKYMIEYNGQKYINKRGFDTLPNGGRWQNKIPFI
jgi:hypothetical protein